MANPDLSPPGTTLAQIKGCQDAVREALESRGTPEPLYEFTERVGLPADQPVLVNRTAFGDFVKAPDGTWGWVVIDNIVDRV